MSSSEVDVENESSWTSFIKSVLVDIGSENDCTVWYANSYGLKGIRVPNESNSVSEGTKDHH